MKFEVLDDKVCAVADNKRVRTDFASDFVATQGTIIGGPDIQHHGLLVVEPFPGLIQELQFVFQKVLAFRCFEVVVVECVVIGKSITAWTVTFDYRVEGVKTTNV